MSDTTNNSNNNTSNSTPTAQASQAAQAPASVPERTTVVSVIMQVKNGAQGEGKTKDTQ